MTIPSTVISWIEDSLWDRAKNVLGLPCICDTPELHSTECHHLRAVAHSCIEWSRREERRKEPTQDAKR